MKIKDQLTAALSELSLDNTPTPERQEKSDFSIKQGEYRVRTIAERLYGRGDITEDQFNSCRKWQDTYVLRTDGPGAIQDRPSTSIIKHDVISFAMDQALRSDSIPAICETVGKAAHNLLILSLYECFNSSRIGEMLLPHTPVGSRNKAVDRLCKQAYEQLNDFYFAQYLDKRKKSDRSVA
ncbi:MAG: hypothetical protein [Bacteriophage sp.]|nr:MAG: hypothetical protein [Bacteriophage sp.]